MPLRIHFISGLPRSGSTLLAAIFRQNPKVYASIQSPVADICSTLLRGMSSTESAIFVSDEQRKRVLKASVEAYYADISETMLILDSNRTWCALLPALVQLFPDCRIICCVRNPAWILDSLERLVQRNALLASKMFGHDVGSVYNRVDT